MPVVWQFEKYFVPLPAKNPKVERVPSPLICQIQISNLLLTFQILTEIASLMSFWVFHFSYSFQDFRFDHLSTVTLKTILQEFFFHYRAFFQNLLANLQRERSHWRVCYHSGCLAFLRQTPRLLLPGMLMDVH